MDAIVIAGGTPAPEEPLYPYTQGRPKAMLDLAGKPMIQWVLDALCEAQTIERVVIVGLHNEPSVTCPKLVAQLENSGDMLGNIRAGTIEVLRHNPNAKHVAIVSSDIPAILPEHVDWIVRTAMETDDDGYYNVITRQTMEARYPGSKRSYIRLKDMEVCGGDLNVVRCSTVLHEVELWNRIIDSRKSALKQAALLGYDTLFLLLFRLIGLESGVKRVVRRLKITGRALVCPYAEIGMDVDKPHQLEMMRADLARRMETVR